MLIQRSIKNNGNLYPSVYNLLSSLPESILHHKEQKLRHPVGIYNVSLGKINECFMDILILLDKVSNHTIKEPSDKELDEIVEELLKNQERLLLSLQSHIDDCYLILKSLHPKVETKKDIIFTDQWLQSVKHPTINQFKDKTSGYRKKLGSIVNKIKHEHNRLRSFMVFSPSIYAIGYFVECADNNESIGPNPNIHQGGDTGISFNRDLKYHLYEVYEISERLKEAIKEAVNITYGLKLEESNFKAESTKWEEITNKISKLPYNFFPDEKLKPIPEITFKHNDTDTSLTLLMPSKLTIELPRNTKISLLYQGDGVTRSFQIPYFFPRKYEKESLY